MRFGEGAGRTSRDAPRATSAPVGLWPVGRKLQRRQNFPEKKPGAEFCVDQHRALAMPAEAGLRRVIAFEDRAGIDVASLVAAKFGKKPAEFFELGEHQVVVIATPGVTRDPAGSWRSRLLALPIVEPDD